MTSGVLEWPGNRRPLTWERNQIQVLLLEGYDDCCATLLYQVNSQYHNITYLRHSLDYRCLVQQN